MTFLTLSIAAIALAAAPQSPCSLPPSSGSQPRVYTNADLDRMSACRYQTGAQSEAATPAEGTPRGPLGRSKPGSTNAAGADQDALEADWRARWRSVDDKVRKLRQEARELRQEAGEVPRDPKKPTTGRRSASVLIGRARSLEAKAQELEDEFQASARQQGARPGWLRPRAR